MSPKIIKVKRAWQYTGQLAGLIRWHGAGIGAGLQRGNHGSWRRGSGLTAVRSLFTTEEKGLVSIVSPKVTRLTLQQGVCWPSSECAVRCSRQTDVTYYSIPWYRKPRDSHHELDIGST